LKISTRRVFSSFSLSNKYKTITKCISVSLFSQLLMSFGLFIQLTRRNLHRCWTLAPTLLGAVCKKTKQIKWFLSLPICPHASEINSFNSLIYLHRFPHPGSRFTLDFQGKFSHSCTNEEKKKKRKLKQFDMTSNVCNWAAARTHQKWRRIFVFTQFWSINIKTWKERNVPLIAAYLSNNSPNQTETKIWTAYYHSIKYSNVYPILSMEENKDKSEVKWMKKTKTSKAQVQS
jgi:hypothetical protein